MTAIPNGRPTRALRSAEPVDRKLKKLIYLKLFLNVWTMRKSVLIALFIVTLDY